MSESQKYAMVACVRENDTENIIAINPAQEISSSTYARLATLATRVRDLDDGSESGSQAFYYPKAIEGHNDEEQNEAFVARATSRIRGIARTTIGEIALDPVMSHVSERVIPSPLPFNEQ